MDHAFGVFSGLEIVTTFSYLVIAAFFCIRALLEGPHVRLLWPWLLMSIFVLCGVTRAIAFIAPNALGDPFALVLHFTLAAVSLAYATGQAIYACWPELFDGTAHWPSWAVQSENTVQAATIDPAAPVASVESGQSDTASQPS